MLETTAYLIIHGVTTLGAMVTFLVRNEHRITRLETTVTLLKEQHDRYTMPAFPFHKQQP